MLRIALLILCVGAATTLAACGQKGPLYVPGVAQDARWPYPDPQRKSAPAAPRPEAPAVGDEVK